MKTEFDRTISLLGEDNFYKITAKTILIVGLGGVGGTALEALVRTGFSSFILVDFDSVDITNLNRQILYTQKDIGCKKVDCAKERILAINPNAKVLCVDKKISNEILENNPCNFIVDAIDDVEGKKLIASYALENNIPFIVSLGMANRKLSTEIIVTRLDKTTNDPLAKKLRHEYKLLGLDTTKINCVFSKEIPVKKDAILSSIMLPPSSAGLAIAQYVLHYCIENNSLS